MFDFLRKNKKDVELFYNTDVHCHIMPGVDHGAQTIDQALELLEAEKKMGINRVFLTSHVTAGTFENTPQTLTEAFNIFSKAVEEAGLGMELHVSAEYRIDEYWETQWKAGAILPLPGNYILMENSFQQELLQLDDLMFELMVKGYNPILAHPERYSYYAHRHHRYEKMHNAGVKFQLNILSLAGYFGPVARGNAEWLIKNNMVDMLGTDMHHIEHAHIIQEYLKSKDWKKLSSVLEPHIINDLIK